MPPAHALRILLLCLIAAPPAALVFPQPREIRFGHISVEEGLSNFTPVFMAEDKEGFLWIGTEDGLNRYDGYAFATFRNSPRDSGSLSTNNITGLCVDSDGGVWVTTGTSELERYDAAGGRFEKIRVTRPTGRSLTAGTLLAGDDGIVWAATSAGLMRFNARTLRVEAFYAGGGDPRTSLTTEMVRRCSRDIDGSLWVGTIHGLNRLDPRTNAVTQIHSVDDSVGAQPSDRDLSRDDFTAAAVDREGTVWLGTGAGLLRMDRHAGRPVPVRFGLQSGRDVGEILITSLLVDDRGVVLVGTQTDGLLTYDRARDAFYQERHRPGDPRSLASDRVTCLYQDRSGVIWAGTYRGGLNRYDRRRDRFRRFPAPEEFGVYAVCEDSRGEIWIGTAGAGILRYRRGATEPETLVNDPRRPASLANNSVFAFHEDSAGDMWIGLDGTLDRFERTTGKFHHYDFAKRFPGIAALETKVVFADAEGELWIGSNGLGLLRYDAARDAFIRYAHDEADPRSMSGGGVWAIFQDSRRRLWVGTFGGGLSRFDRASNSFSHIIGTEGDTTTLSSNAVYCIAEDRRGSLWVGTFGGGLNRIDTSTGRAAAYRIEDGLPDNFVKQIVPDSRGTLWISTDKGLSCFDPAARSFRTYTEEDGLHGSVFLSGASWKNREGVLYFGGKGGVTAFNPDSLSPKGYKPPVVVTNFRVFGKEYPLDTPVSSAREIRLPYDANSFSLEFVALDYSLPARNQYAYRLDGIDPEWVRSGPRRFANYTRVPPGEYLFTVRGSNSDGVWNERGASVRIVVAPPFWERWWFRALALCAIGAIGAALYNYRVNSLLNIERLRVRIASDLHDDIGSSLTKISMQSELIQEGVPADEQRTYLRSIAALSRELVSSMGDIVWSIDARNDTVGDMVDRMRSFGESVLAAPDVRFALSQEGLDDARRLPIDVRQNLYLLYKEAVTNIAKHAHAARVDVTLRNGPEAFTMAIADDGAGGEGAGSGGGHGMRNMEMRAERLGGTLLIAREGGTRILLTMRRL